MKKTFRVVRDILNVLFVLAVAFGVGFYLGGSMHEEKEIIVEDKKSSFDLELPMEVEKRVVTAEEVQAKLFEIGELSTFSGKYEFTKGVEETRYLLEEIPVFGSTNIIQITCEGIVKVGYNMSDIVVRVDAERIYISIPEAQLNDNYVIWDSMVCKESNNMLNPIEFAQYQEIIDEIEKAGLEKVIAQGIYQQAEENLKTLIETFLAEFDGYTVVYM